MTGRKRLKLSILWLARVVGLFALARRLTAGTVKILGYHYVSMEDEERRFPHLYVTPDQLRDRLEHLRRCYRIVSLDDAVRALDEGRPGRGLVAITFDDGAYNFAAAAAPILAEYEVPATVYMVTAHVTNGIPFCALLLRDVFLRSDASRLASAIPGLPTEFDLSSAEGRNSFETEVTELLLSYPHASPERLELVRAVAEALGVDVDSLIERRIWDVLDEEEMRALVDQGFSVELHGHHHINVVEETEDVYDEVMDCARVIEKATGRTPRHYCYPTGLWCRAAWPALEKAGVMSATTTLYGSNSPQTPLLSLRRFMDGGSLTQLEFEFELSGLRWLIWGLRHRSERWRPAEKLVTYRESGQLY